MSTGLVLLLGGRGQRAETRIPKQFQILGSQPVYKHALRQFVVAAPLQQVVLVSDTEFHSKLLEQCCSLSGSIRWTFALPGNQRHLSTLNGLEALDESIEKVLIHDGARPNPGVNLIQRLFDACSADSIARVPALPVTDTIKIQNDQRWVVQTPERNTLRAAQTPQMARRKDLLQAYAQLPPGCTPTDEASILEAAGYPVRLEEGSATNLKITWPEDFQRMQKYLEAGE